MTAGQYSRHLAIIGKLVKMWDDANGYNEGQEAFQPALYDQVADGEVESFAVVQMFGAAATRLAQTLVSGPQAIMAWCDAMFERYIQNPYFYGDLNATPTSLTTTGILTQFATTQVADGVTLTTESSVGLVHYFKRFKSDISLTTEADGSADIKDSVYCALGIVADPE